jgi:hypothetical protein
VKKGCPCIAIKRQLMENSNFHEHINHMVLRMACSFVLCVLCLHLRRKKKVGTLFLLI